MKKLLVTIVCVFLTGSLLAQSASTSPTPANPPRAIPVARPVTNSANGTNAPIAKPASAIPVAPAVPAPLPLPQQVNQLSEADLSQILPLLKSNFTNANDLTDNQISRATVQGLLERLSPGAKLINAVAQKTLPSPFRAEILDNRIGYLRLGSISQDNLGQMDSALKDFAGKSLKSVILDLRATPPSGDYKLAAEILKRFCPKGKVLFTLKKPNAKQERIFTSNQDPLFHGVIVAVVNSETAGAAEAIAGALRIEAQAMIVGEKTKGEGVEYANFPLHSGKILRVAVAEITLPGNRSIFPNGLAPDITVSEPEAQQREILQKSLQSGVSQFIFETGRPHFNEASLVSGATPDIDAYEAAENPHEKKPVSLHDQILQRATDLITTLSIFKQRPALSR